VIRLAVLAGVLLATAVPAQARPVSASDDGRPNILVVMTDDMAVGDLEHMPNVQRLIVDQGTSFTGAVDSYPLCCPARATFITGQYTHNHLVGSNFYPDGWYGMKDRANILPAWLQGAGYQTALIGKWLNGYGARDGHGEVPHGFDLWRGLLDVSAYDYFNYVMNSDGELRIWGDAEFARKLVEFAEIQVTFREEPGAADVFAFLEKVMGPRPYTYWGTEDQDDYSPDVTGEITERLVAAQRKAKDPFLIWWSPASPHREDVANALMGRPGPDPRAPARYQDEVADLKLPEPPNFNEPDLTDKGPEQQAALPELSDARRAQLELNYQGRIGSLLAVDEHVKHLVATLRRTKQLDNTLIVFLSDNGWMQGEHRIPGDKYLPYEESLRVPFVLRGPGVPAGRTVSAQVANIDFAPTLVDAANARARRKMDGISLLPIARRPRRLPERAIALEAPKRLLTGDFPAIFNGWDRPYQGVRTERYTYVKYLEDGFEELYDRDKDPYELRNVAGHATYAKVKVKLQNRAAKVARCRGAACLVEPQMDSLPRPAGKVRRRALHIEGRTKTIDAVELGLVEDRGTITGKPFGKGTIELVGRLAGGRLEARVRMHFPRGDVMGQVSAPFTIEGDKIIFEGTARVRHGSGAYRGITSGTIRIRDVNTLDGQNGVITVDGFVTY
jgi:N-acetylglucosamine-6-sulfatase